MQKSVSTSEAAHLCFSVIFPSYQRRDVVLDSVRALAYQKFDGDFEVIVVVDGSTDGSAEALRQLPLSFPLTVIEQPNQGASVARNQGAAAARGEILLFLDDDMEAHPELLQQHQRSHQDGAGVVLGHIPLHPESPSNFLSEAVGRWADKRVHYLMDGEFPVSEFMTGQLSISRKTFFDLGGFDTNFTRDGEFGNEDLDFGLRVMEHGLKIVFNPDAISWQKYVVTFRQYLRQYRQAGRADVLFARIHPTHAADMFYRRESTMDRIVWRWFRWPIRLFVLTLLGMGSRDFGPKLFSWLVNLEYFQGVRDAGGIAMLQRFCRKP